MESFTRLPEGDTWLMLYNIPEELRLNSKQFEALWNLHPAEYNTVMMYGKPIKTPRWQQSFGRDYYYSGMNHSSISLKKLDVKGNNALKYLRKLKKYTNQHYKSNFDNPKGKYSSALVNWYQDGAHYIGAHSDDETQLVKSSPIYSYSFGQTRTFKITSKRDKGIPTLHTKIPAKERYKLELDLTDGQVLIMGGEFQKYYHHEVPKRSINKIKERRINITFRMFRK